MAGLSRLEGRLFAEAGRLCLVAHVDEEAGTARVSYQADGNRHVVERSLDEVRLSISSSDGSQIDAITRMDTKTRVRKRGDAWFFNAREGEQGPFPTPELAEQSLRKHVMAVQTG